MAQKQQLRYIYLLLDISTVDKTNELSLEELYFVW